MFFGATAFSEVPFAGLPLTGAQFIGITGIALVAVLNRVVVDTAFNINATIDATGNQLIVQQGSLVTWIPINSNSPSIWTEIGA